MSATEQPDRQLKSLAESGLGNLFTAVSIRIEGSGYVHELVQGATDRTGSSPVSLVTRFDLASISKVFTSSAVLRLIDAGVVGLDDPMHKYLPTYGSTPVRQQVTIRALLSHQAGMPRSLPNMEYAGRDPQQRWENFLELRWKMVERALLNKLPGQLDYSDVGYMLLGRVIEAATQTTLDRAIQRLVCEPLGLTQSGFGGDSRSPRTREGAEPGQVHDQKGAALGGACGHAGVFSTAADVSRLARAYLPGSDFLSYGFCNEAIREQASDDAKGIRRGLGWELRSSIKTEPEDFLDRNSFGHTGFTGTLVWTDPRRLLTVTVLTNGVLIDNVNAPLGQLYRDVVKAAVAIDGSKADYQIS